MVGATRGPITGGQLVKCVLLHLSPRDLRLLGELVGAYNFLTVGAYNVKLDYNEIFCHPLSISPLRVCPLSKTYVCAYIIQVCH